MNEMDKEKLRNNLRKRIEKLNNSGGGGGGTSELQWQLNCLNMTEK